MNKKIKHVIASLSSAVISSLYVCSFNTITASAYTASITTSDSFSINASISGDGVSIHRESINVVSDCRSGYNLSIAAPEGSNLYVDGDGEQIASFTAVDGSSALNSPVNTNKWGYTLETNPSGNTVFSPLSSTESILKSPAQTASQTSDINDTFNINYGVKVNNTIAPGNYRMANNGSIVYYLTMDATCTQYTVSYNPNGGSGSMDDQNIEMGESFILPENTFTAPSFGESYQNADNDTVPGTATTLWRFNGWNTEVDGTGTSYNNQEEVTDITDAGGAVTLYAQWEAISVMKVNFDSNGMAFEDDSTNNVLGYHHSDIEQTIVRKSHTSNIDDDGAQIDSNKYDNNLATKDVITIPGATSLQATITYGTEYNWDMLYVFEGEYNGPVGRNMNAGELAKYMGGNDTTSTVALDIPGDTATFAFYSGSSGQYWGYYASVVGYDENNEPVTGPVRSRSLIYGEYQEPPSNNSHLFQGWSENSAATTPDYTSAEDVLNNLSGDNNDVKTLYAVWSHRYHISYVNNCYIYASTNEACTVATSEATSEQIIDLDISGDGSTILKPHDAWTGITGWKIVGWNTSADGSGIEYAPSSTYAVAGQSAGDSITLYAHWAPVYTIQYDGNSADNPNGMGTTNVDGTKSVRQINISEGDSITLLPSNFKRAGYGFAGWSTSNSATTTSGDKIYGPMETISAPAYPNNGTGIITMYAVWIPAEKDGNNQPFYLQNFGATECDSLNGTSFNSNTGEIVAGDVIALTDKRDNEVYTIAKLADSKCWMIENLRIESASTLGNSINDSSVTNESLSQGYGGTPNVYGSFVGLADSETAHFTESTTPNTIYKATSNTPTDTYDPVNNMLEDIGTLNNPGYRFPRYNSDNTQNLVDSTSYTQDYSDATNPSDNGTNYRTDSNVYSYGNYYTWNAAMANTTSYGSATGPSGSEGAGTSLCPSGWALPTIGEITKDYSVLSQTYGGTGNNQSGASEFGDTVSNRLRVFPNNFLYSGNYDNSAGTNRGMSGDYWSQSAVNYVHAHQFSLTPTTISLTDYSATYYGYSIRCLIPST